MKTMRFLAAVVTSALLLACVPAKAQDAALSLEANAAFLAENAKKPGVFKRPSGLQFKILQNGFGKRPARTDTVSVYYTGRLINGTVFDGTSQGLPAFFQVGRVVPGWVEALQLMREGDHWQLVLPANIGYGARGAPGGLIPPNQTLMFDLKLISTIPKPVRGEKGYVPDPSEQEEQR